MESTALVTPDSSGDKMSHFHLVKWTNRLLKTNFKDVQEMGSGDLSVCADLMQFFHTPTSAHFKHADLQ